MIAGDVIEKCSGQTEAIHEAVQKIQDMKWRRTGHKGKVDQLQHAKNRSKSSLRAKVEHPFRILKRVLDWTKYAIGNRKTSTNAYLPALHC